MHRLASYLHHLSWGWHTEDEFGPIRILRISKPEPTNSIKIFYDCRSHRLVFVSMACLSEVWLWLCNTEEFSSNKSKSNKAAKCCGVALSQSVTPPPTMTCLANQQSDSLQLSLMALISCQVIQTPLLIWSTAATRLESLARCSRLHFSNVWV